MSREHRHVELQAKTQQLLKGSLKHVRAAALAAALVPLASVAVSQAVALDGCSGGVCPPPVLCDFATSGGFVFTNSAKKANFGAHGGCKNGEFWGHVNFQDQGLGLHVNSLEILGYLDAGPTVRDICGTATTNGAGGQPVDVDFRVRIADYGEPGIADQFGIRLKIKNVDVTTYLLTTRVLNGGMGRGGNVQLHDPNPSTAGPDPAPDEAAMCNGVEAP